jgi:HAD superfamily hydrolase (TIGR01490 family)
VKKIKEVNEIKELKLNIAAFFDLDGTLMARPSMERRFFRLLRYRREIGVRNYCLWLREAVRLMEGGIRKMLQANKMYLRGVQSFDVRGGTQDEFCSGHKSDDQVEGQTVAALLRNPRLPVVVFFTGAVERVVWHAKEGHTIVLLSGTLEPLAKDAARSLEAELAVRAITTRVRVCATRLEEKDGRWTGRILDEAMIGETKARAAKQLAEEFRLDLGRCYAYGDSSNDRWLMETVGRPAAVNPSKELAGIARTHRWPILNWQEKENVTQSAQRSRREKKLRSAFAGWNW